MPWGVVAAAGISYVGASKASKRSAAASGSQLAFEQEKYDSWKEIYGDIEQNLADYYTQLTPETLVASGLEAEEEAFAKARTELTTRIAQRGIEGGGLEADLLAKQEIQSAERRADIRVEAEEDVREQQSQFLRGGESKRTQIEARQSALRSEQARGAEAAAQSAYQSTAQIVGAGIKYATKSPSATVQPSPTIAAPSAYETRRSANEAFRSGGSDYDSDIGWD